MSDEDLEIIPILEDVLVAGDLDKAVTGDIDVNDLESIESFDALFENQQSIDNETPEENLLPENTEDTDVIKPTDDLFYSSGLDSLNDDIEHTESVSDDAMVESVVYETQSFESDEAEDIKQDNSTFVQETNELTNNNQALIDQVFDYFDENDVDTQEISEAQGEVISEPETSEATLISDAEPEQQSIELINQEPTHQESTSQEPEPEIDLSEIVEKVTQDIMPELETQIRSLVLTSLKKHLTESVNSLAADSNTDSDQDL